MAQGERVVEALAQVSGLTVANTSQHLQHLRQTGLVVSHRVGLKVYYRLSGDDVLALFDCLRGVAERRLADVERLINTYLTVKDSLEPVPADELLERERQGLVTVLDVRPPEEYAAGHLPGAINIPLSKLVPRSTLLYRFQSRPDSPKQGAVRREGLFSLPRTATPHWRNLGGSPRARR